MKRSQSRSDAEHGRVVANGVSRRELIAAGGAMAAAATSSPLIANTASAQGGAGADATLDRLRRAASDSGCRRHRFPVLARGCPKHPRRSDRKPKRSETRTAFFALMHLDHRNCRRLQSGRVASLAQDQLRARKSDAPGLLGYILCRAARCKWTGGEPLSN
jgi:hypothetical protein